MVIDGPLINLQFSASKEKDRMRLAILYSFIPRGKY